MKTLYFTSRHTLLIILSVILLASSCSKKSDPDPRDQYVGIWNQTMIDGQPATGNKIDIYKSGEGLALKDFTPKIYTASLSGSGFQADNSTIPTDVQHTFPDRSVGQLYLQNLAGSVTGKELSLTYRLYSQSPTFIYSQNVTMVFTKQ